MEANEPPATMGNGSLCQSGLILQLRDFTDEELIEFVLTNPREGRYFMGLYCRYRSLVESITAVNSQNPAIAGTVWILAYRRLTEYNPQSQKFLSWLTVLSADTLAQVMRSNQKLLTGATTLNPVLLAYIDQGLRKLSAPQRFILILHEIYQWTVPQIKKWMADQQWQMDPQEIDALRQQGRQLLLDFLPTDIKSLCWNNQLSNDQHFNNSLQALEFDAEIEQESFRQWYVQHQSNDPPQATQKQLRPWWGLAALLVLGVVGWQGASILTSGLASGITSPVVVSEETVENNIEEAPALEPSKLTQVPKEAPTPISTPDPVEPDQPDGDQPRSKTQPAPEAKSTPPLEVKPNQPVKAAKAIPPEAKPLQPVKPKSDPAPPPEVTPVKKTVVAVAPTLTRVLIVVSDPTQLDQVKKQFPSSFNKACGDATCLQVGAFKTINSAESLASKLRSQGLSVTVQTN